jgi:hypothetical protein
MWESRAIFVSGLDELPDRLVREGIPTGGAAVVRLLLVTAVALGLAVWRTGRMRLAGASD